MQLLSMDSRAALVSGRPLAAPVPFFRTVVRRPASIAAQAALQPPPPPSPTRTQPPPPDTCTALPRDVASRFGRRIRELRHAKGMTQLQVAVHFGIDRTFISDVERGRKSVCLPTLEVFALGFGVSLSDLLRGI